MKFYKPTKKLEGLLGSVEVGESSRNLNLSVPGGCLDEVSMRNYFIRDPPI